MSLYYQGLYSGLVEWIVVICSANPIVEVLKSLVVVALVVLFSPLFLRLACDRDLIES